MTGKGSGHVTFSDSKTREHVLGIEQHILDGNTIYPKPFDPLFKAREVFVGGLPDDATETLLKEGFSRFGEVNHAKIIYHHSQIGIKISRGFGFICFSNEDAAERAIAEHSVTLMGTEIEIKRVKRD